MKSNLKKKAVYALYIILVTFISLEIILRIYNPFPFRLKYNKIILPINQKLIIENKINAKLDRKIVNTRNSLGFRGPEKPDSFEKYLSIITVGGSTTACYFLSDGKTWPDKLREKLGNNIKQLWLNNAGFDGHSTFGHQVLLNDYLVTLKPKIILFLVGINDVENDQPSFHDKLNIRGAYPDFKHFIFTNSEVLSLGLNLVRGWKAQKHNNTTHKAINLQQYSLIDVPESEVGNRIKKNHPYLQKFRTRLSSVIDTCKAYNIVPIFMTQPILFGKGVDTITGIDLERFNVGENYNGKLAWQELELYNNVTRATCRQNNVPVIDLAQLLPKSSAYFYDISHYTNEGAKKVSEVVAPELTKIVQARFPDYYH